jgi:hypothetical protein
MGIDAGHQGAVVAEGIVAHGALLLERGRIPPSGDNFQGGTATR